MVMSWIFTGILGLSIFSALYLGRGQLLGQSVLTGAKEGVTLAISMAGAICLWSGVGALMEKTGISRMLSRLLQPILHRVFPTSKKDPKLKGALSANICANFLGLGNAATPMGIQAARQLSLYSPKGAASNELCRLIVLNTASIQLIPSTVAAIRVNAGCQTPFDILPAVWVTSLCSASAGLLAAWLLGKVWKA